MEKNKNKKFETVIISHNSIPPTVLEIYEWGYQLRFARNVVPISFDEAAKIVHLLTVNVPKAK